MAKKNSCDCSCPTGSCHHNNGCGEEEEKVLTESGLKHIIDKLTGKLLLAVGTIKAKGEDPLHLWRKYTKLGVIIHGKVDEATPESSGLLSAEDKAFLDKLREWFGEVESFTPITAERIKELWGDWTCGGGCGGGGDGGDDNPEPEPDPEPVGTGSLSVTLSYPNIPGGGGSVEPEYHVYQEVEMSDGTTEKVEVTELDSVEFSSVYAAGSGSLNSATGVVSVASLNHSGSDEVVRTVRITVTKGDEIAETTCDVIQETAYISDYGEISVSLSYPTLGINGGTVEPTYSVYQNVTWSDGMTGSITIEPDSVEFEFVSSLDGAEIDGEDGGVTYSERNDTKESRTIAIVRITATYGDLSASDTANVVQECFMITGTSINGKVGWDIGEELHNNSHDWSMLSMLGGTYPLMAKGLKTTVSTNDGSKSYDISLEDCVIRDVNLRDFSEYLPYEDYIKLNEDNSVTVGCSYDVEYRSATYLSLCVGSVYLSWYCEEYDTWFGADFTFNVYQVTWLTGNLSAKLSLSYPTVPAEGGSFLPDYDINVVYDDYSDTNDDRNYRIITMDELEEHGQIEGLKFIKRIATDQIQEATVDSETGELYVPENTTGEERHVYTELDATVMGRLRTTEYIVTQEAND